MDLTKLSPAPWDYDFYEGFGTTICMAADGKTGLFHGDHDEVCFAVLARNAFDVMMRRGWTVVCVNRRWHVSMMGASESQFQFGNLTGNSYADPFTALVEADKWYRENVEKQA